MFKWLSWDGRYQLNGSCNQQLIREFEDQLPLNMPELCWDSGSDPAGFQFVVDDRIEVRILDLIERSGDIAVKIDLANFWHVRCLMIRVYRGTRCAMEDLVYQEILDRPGLVNLPDAFAESRAGLPPTPALPDLVDGLDSPVDTTPHSFRIWVANRPGSFSAWSGDWCWEQNEPQVEPGTITYSGCVEAFSPLETRSWSSFFQKSASQHRQDPQLEQTRQPHRSFLAATGGVAQIQATLKRAASQHVPFTDVLLRFSRPVCDGHSRKIP